MAYVIGMTTSTGAALFGYGATEADAWAEARRQVAGGPGPWVAHMLFRMIARPVSDDRASEIEEMLAADVIEWTDTGRATC